MQLFDKVRIRRTSEEVAVRLRRHLVDGTLKPGEKLPRDEVLSKGLGVSRGAVREALKALEADGVIESRRGRNGGAFIRDVKPSVLSEGALDLLQVEGVTIEQLTEARLWVEDAVVRAACVRATDEDLAKLEANTSAARAQYDRGLLTDKALTLIKFHDLLANATRNPMLVVIVKTLTEVMSAFARVNGGDPSTTTFVSRKRFIAAMRARDVEAAVDEMRKNTRYTEKVYLRVARQRKIDATARTASHSSSPAAAGKASSPAAAPKSPRAARNPK
ncbi:FadR/GntR family transcriptional regulator [soil metagenome]